MGYCLAHCVFFGTLQLLTFDVKYNRGVEASSLSSYREGVAGMAHPVLHELVGISSVGQQSPLLVGKNAYVLVKWHQNVSSSMSLLVVLLLRTLHTASLKGKTTLLSKKCSLSGRHLRICVYNSENKQQVLETWSSLSGFAYA